MSYITYAEYKAINPTSAIEDGDDFNLLESYAAAIIDRITLDKIPLLGGTALEDGLAAFSAFTQARVKKSMAAQVDILDAQGGIDAVTGLSGLSGGGFTLGKFSELSGSSSGGSGSEKVQQIDSMPVSPLIKGYLRPTNLLYMGANRTYRLSDIT